MSSIALDEIALLYTEYKAMLYAGTSVGLPEPGNGRKKTMWKLAVTLALAGCAVAPQEPPSAEAMKPLICKDKAQCDLYWSRAQAWVANNGGYRIQTVSDSIISTYGPSRGSVELASQVTREANADGSARIRIRLSCDNMFGCRPTPAEGAVSFKRYVQGG